MHPIDKAYCKIIEDAGPDPCQKAEAHLRLGQIADLETRRQEARMHYRRAIDLDPPENIRRSAEKYLQKAYRRNPA
ncbi:MAG: hypothetical protein JXR49_23180 [Acidobacteria bacterium]|nr:hypothetical protein [Acidobacteriota bacterium]